MAAANPFNVNVVPDPVGGGVYKYQGVLYEFLGTTPAGYFSQVYFHFRLLTYADSTTIPGGIVPNVPWVQGDPTPADSHRWLSVQEWRQQHALWTIVPDPVEGGLYRYGTGVYYECLGTTPAGRNAAGSEVLYFKQDCFHFRLLPRSNVPNVPWVQGDPMSRGTHLWLSQPSWREQHAEWTRILPENLSPRNRPQPPLQRTRKTTPPR